MFDANERFKSDSGSDAVTGSTTTTVEDGNGDGFIVVVIDTSANPTSEITRLISGPVIEEPVVSETIIVDVTCGDGSTLAAAIADCFASVDFSLLIPESL